MTERCLLLSLRIGGCFLHPPSVEEFPLHLISQMGGDNLSEGLDDISHLWIRR